MCDIITNLDTMARDDFRMTILGGSGHSGSWRPQPETKEEKTELIHSGHFMVSDPFKGQPGSRPGYNFQEYASSSTSQTYRFNQPDLEIDSSFATLFECLNLAYTGCKIVSPKWKTFKGQKVGLQNKIRLNNAIWREWHNQFIIGKKPFLCQFSLPALDNEFSVPSSVVLEGKYGKRTTTAVIGEYQKWRAFYMKQKNRSLLGGDPMDTSQSLTPYEREFLSMTGQTPMVLDEDTLLSEFSDTLFSSLNQSFIFPNPKEFSHAGVIVDAIQPGLVGLQPPLEELMDTLDVLPDIKPNQPFVFTAGDQSNFQNDISSMLQAQQPSQSMSSMQAQLQGADTLDPMLASSDTLGSQDLNSILMQDLSQVGPTSLIAPQQPLPQMPQQQQQQPTTATNVVLTPQLLGQLLQMQQQQQVQQPRDPKTQQQSTVLNLDNSILSGLNINLASAGISGGNTSSMPGVSGIVLQTQQSSLEQQQLQQSLQQQMQQQQPQSSLLQQHLRQAVPVKLTKAMDIDEPSRGSPGLARTVQKGQNRIVISSSQVSQQQQKSGPSRNFTGVSSGVLSPQQLQLLQQSAQNIIQQQTISPLVATAGKSDQSNYMQDFTYSSVQVTPPSHARPPSQATPPSQASRRRMSAPPSQQRPTTSQQRLTTSTNQKKAATSNQTQALKLLQKVASHVSQNSPSSMPLFSEEQKTIFTRIFGEGAEPRQAIIVSSASSSQATPTRLSKAPQFSSSIRSPQQKPPTKATPSQKTVLFHTGPVGSTNAGTTSAGVSRDSHRKARMKQTISKKPILKATPTATNSKINSSALLTHLLTGGKYDPNSGIVLTAASPSVSNVVVTTVKDNRDVRPKPKVATGGSPTVLAARPTASRITPVGSPAASSSKTSEPSLFTIGPKGASPVEPPMAERSAESSEDKSIVTAEQRRRTNIRTGFEFLHQIIPSVSQNPNSKVSKAAMLQKSIDYIRKLQAEKSQLTEETKLLKDEIDTLNTAISESQSQLPASGVPATTQRYNQLRDSFDEYVRIRTEQNWKFWIFSIIIRPLFESFNGMVSTANREELCRTILSWLDRHCSLLALRPTVLSSLTLLSRITSILSDPTQVPQQAVQAVHKRDRANSVD